MAIVINGSGTVTGISVGGLPDGIVDSDTLANNAITASALPTGSVLQVKQQVFDTFTQIASTSYQDTGLTLAITPSSASSKIFVLVSMQLNTNNANNQQLLAKLVRGSTDIRLFDRAFGAEGNNPNAQVSFNYLDSPNTTSSITYKITMRGHNSDNLRINNYYGSNGGAASTLTLMEIAG